MGKKMIQHVHLMPFAACALRAAALVTNGALQERAAQQLAGDRQLVDQLLTRLKGSITKMNQRRRLKSTPVRPTLQFSSHQAILAASQGRRILRRKVASNLLKSLRVGSIEPVDGFQMGRGNSDQPAYKFDFSVPN